MAIVWAISLHYKFEDMGYTTLSIRKKDETKKYILFYADYLNEAWLSEVTGAANTRIIRQFKCKTREDLEKLTAFISKKGEIISLSSEHEERFLELVRKELSQPRRSTHSGLSLASLRLNCSHWISLFTKRQFAN